MVKINQRDPNLGPIVGPLFTCTYDNKYGCASCGDEILEGNLAGYIDHKLSCEECVRATWAEKEEGMRKR